MFFLSKPWVPLTDRLQRFELKIFVCVLLKKQSDLHLGCPGGKQINIFRGTISFRSFVCQKLDMSQCVERVTWTNLL